MRLGDDRQVCHRLLQRLALVRRAIIGIYFPPIQCPMTGENLLSKDHSASRCHATVVHATACGAGPNEVLGNLCRPA